MTTRGLLLDDDAALRALVADHLAQHGIVVQALAPSPLASPGVGAPV